MRSLFSAYIPKSQQWSGPNIATGGLKEDGSTGHRRLIAPVSLSLSRWRNSFCLFHTHSARSRTGHFAIVAGKKTSCDGSTKFFFLTTRRTAKVSPRTQRCVYHSSIGDGYRRQDGNSFSFVLFFKRLLLRLSMNQISEEEEEEVLIVIVTTAAPCHTQYPLPGYIPTLSLSGNQIRRGISDGK